MNKFFASRGMSVWAKNKRAPPTWAVTSDPQAEHNLLTNGFSFLSIEKDVFSNWRNRVTSHIRQINFNLDQDDSLRETLRAGYSIPFRLPFELSLEILELGESLCKQPPISNYLRKPTLINILASYSIFDSLANTNPTHAHLWHKDFDDRRPQIKVMIPFSPCSEENGCFKVVSKSVTPKDFIRDARMEKIRGDHENEYFRQDLVRVTDETMLELAADQIFALETDGSDGTAMMVDTNSCYHKGGLVKCPGQYRVMVQITIGEPTHMWLEERSTIRNASAHLKSWIKRYFNR